MVLPQDQAQASQAEAILAERKYQKDLAQYEKDLEKYNTEQKKIEAENKKIADAKAVEQIRLQKAIAVEDKRIADLKVAEAAEAKRIADLKAAEAKRLDDEATVRHNAYLTASRNFSSGTNKHISKQIHYAQVGGVGLAKGDIIIEVGNRGKTNASFHQSYYERVAKSFQNQGYTNITWIEARKISGAGAASMSGKAREQVMRKYLDPSGKMESDYQASRAQAKRNVASAYGSMSAQEASTSSALANRPEVQQAAAQQVRSNLLNELHDVSGGLLGSEATAPTSSQSYKFSDVKATSSNPEYAVQNARQTAYVSELRAGNIGLANALTRPETPQRYEGTSTNNLEQFLSERGQNINKPNTIPDSILMTPVKQTEAREQTRMSGTMGDLRNFAVAEVKPYSDKNIKVGETTVGVTKNEYYRKETNPEIQRRIDARQRVDSIVIPTQATTQATESVQGPLFVTTQYQVTTADGKVRTFNSLESAEKFSQRMAVTQYEVNVPTSVPTMYGAITVQEPILFESKEEAQAFIDNRQANLPYTQGAKILPLEQTYSGYDQFAKESYKRAEQHQGKESSWIYEGGAAWTSFGGDMLNLATIGGDLLDKHVFKREVIEKQPITTIPTYYDKGTEKALEGIEITETGITGVPSFNPLDKNNIASKWYQGAAAQWEKQTPAQNIGQSTVAIPLAIVDVVTAAQAGTSIVRRLGPGITKVATKIASTPTIVTKVVEASVSVKPKIKNPSYANYNINSLANPDKIDLNFRGADYMESRAPTLDLNSLANRGIIPKPPKTVKPVEADPYYSNRRKIDLNLKDSPDYMESPKPPALNLQSEAFQKDLAKQAPKGVGNYGAEQFRKFQESVSPSINVIGRIKLSEGFVPGKPTRSYTPYKPKPVEADPYYSPEKIDLNLKDSPDYMESKAPALNLQSKSFLKEIKKGTPNYERAASDFADFQKSLDPKPQKYSNIVGTIKFSEGFIPNKNPTKVAKKPNTDVKEEPLFKQDKVNKKKIFKDDDKLAGWETKPIEGGQATGSTTVQILKPQTKKPLKTSKKLLQDRQNPTPTARDFTQLESERAVAKSGSSPIKVIPIPRDPTKKKKKKIQTVTTTGTVTSVESGQVLLPKAPQQTVSGVIPKLATSQFSKSKVRQTPKTSNKVVQKPVTMVAQPQKIVAKIKPLQDQRTPTTPRPRTKLKTKPMFRARPRQAQAQPTPRPNRLVTAAAIIDTPKTSKKTTKKTRTRKRKDFLGNTRTYAIVGLFRREEVIYGDKATAKQLKRDKKFKENKKIIRKKKKQKSFGQKIGIISKGFKI